HGHFRAAQSPNDGLRLERLLLEEIGQRLVGDWFQISFHLPIDDAPDRIPPRLTDKAHTQAADRVDELGLLLASAAGAAAFASTTPATAAGRRNPLAYKGRIARSRGSKCGRRWQKEFFVLRR